MKARLLDTRDTLEPTVRVLRQLRTQLTDAELISRIELQRQQDGYQLAIVTDNDGRILSVAGFVIHCKLAWGKSLYVDDLVTDAQARSSGAGKCLLDWLKAYARAHGCRQLHLDSGVQRFDAHRFYLREGFRIASHHFSLDLDMHA